METYFSKTSKLLERWIPAKLVDVQGGDHINKKTIPIFLMLAVLSTICILPMIRVGATSPDPVSNFSLVTEYDLGGQGYNVFFPQTLVAEQGDQINITVRNTGNESFTLNIAGQSGVSIQSGNETAAGVEPAETSVPIFNASNPGIFDLSTDKFPEMNVQIVVLPTDLSNYNPSPQNRNFTQLALPDFSGNGYDKFFPGIMVVNQQDTVNVDVRNTDDMPHGFAIAAYNISVGIDPGEDLPNGTIAPVTTNVAYFAASQAGIFRFICTSPCGPGHLEMVGQLVVLPTQGSTYTPDIITVYGYLTLKLDFAGSGYDRYIPDPIFVNIGDLVYFEIRNTDQQTQGFALQDFGIENQTITGAQNTTTGLVPAITYISPFFADQTGIHEFSCTLNCGSSQDQMNGQLVVLSIQNATSTPPPATSAGQLPILSLILLTIAILIAGVIIGAVITVKLK